MQKTYDVAIVGGGIIGCSTAAHLAKKNIKVCLIDTSTLGISASEASAGMLTPFQHSESENPLIRDFMVKSFQYFDSFHNTIKEEINTDFGYKKNGSLYLIQSSSEISEKDDELKKIKKIEPDLQFFNKREVANTEPGVTKDLVGAYHYPNEGLINNSKFLKGIKSFCSNKDVVFSRSKVIDINLTSGKIESLILCNGEIIKANKFVIANGVWANNVLQQIYKNDLKIIKAVKGEMLEVISDSHNSYPKKIIFTNNGYLFKRDATNKLEAPSIVVGSTISEVELESSFEPFRNTLSGIRYLTDLFNYVLPDIKNTRIKKSWSGLRPCTKDKLPIIGQDKEINNLYFGLGHYRNGILMGPLTGKIICDLITSNETDYSIDLFKPERVLSLRSHVHN